MSETSSVADLVIIGGGAAGLMAATSAASRGLRVMLFEKNRKLGVKILMSGGTRCNITHNCPVSGIVKAFGRSGKFLHSALAALPPLEVIGLIEAQGVETKIESTGKIFPRSDRAIDVRDALVSMATDAGASLTAGATVDEVTPSRTGQGFEVRVDGQTLHSASVLITTGGKSYPGCGTTGDGYAWARAMGHTVTPTVPALVPILSRCQWANELKGVTIEKTGVAIWEKAIAGSDPELPRPKKRKKQRPLVQTTGSFLFTHFGFSGPSVLDVSREVALSENRRNLEMRCDFLPEMKEGQLRELLLEKKKRHAKQLIGNILTDVFPKRLADGLLVAANVPVGRTNAELSNAALDAICQQIKSNQFEINGTLGFEKAEVTAGGVTLSEVDSRSLESKLVPGLYFAGEILDLDGPIGGFNFQSAFSTGWLAGQSIATGGTD